MRITDVESRWLHCPIPEAQQHVSDFGRMTSFDTTLVRIRTDQGLEGYGEAKAAVGSQGGCGSIKNVVDNDLAPILIGRDPRRISELWSRMYNGPRDHYALERGRGFPVLGRRGLLVSAISAVDLALWDLLGKSLGVPVVQLLGGPMRDAMPAYASGGWAGPEEIGNQLGSYVERGFRMVKMRVGVMDQTVRRSVERVRAARAALGPDIEIAVDAHGTFSVPEAKRFCREVEECDLRWFEEPVNADSRVGMAEVRAATAIPIAAGESESTSFDFRDLIEQRAVDVLQPDMAICGGLTEGLRIAALAHTHQLELAPHLWGGALMFMAGLHLAFASEAATVLEVSLGGNPMLYELAEESIDISGGSLAAPDRPGLGITPNRDFVESVTQQM
jgi:L-alanine-DL-glutamate epimerase-like enolase superfamily enzyme